MDIKEAVAKAKETATELFNHNKWHLLSVELENYGAAKEFNVVLKGRDQITTKYEIRVSSKEVKSAKEIL